MFYDPKSIISEKIRAQSAVDEFLASQPSIFEVQTYVQLARNDLAANSGDIYAKQIIKLLSGDSD